jgi:hypothetical protein
LRIRGIAEIIADFPDDQVDEGDEVVLFGGRNVAEAIGAILTELDYSVSPPVHRHEYGWDFEVTSAGKRVWMQVSYLGEHDYVLATDFIPKLGLFVSKKQIYAEMLDRLNKALASDHRFKSVAWVYRGDATDTPASGPLDP